MDKVKYYSDDAVSEMMIYPALQKEKHSEIYSWFSQKFILGLNIARNCVIIGYSFPDKDLRENIIYALYRNSSLWLIIISPNAFIRKMEYFTNIEISSRVIVMNMGVQTITVTVTDDTGKKIAGANVQEEVLYVSGFVHNFFGITNNLGQMIHSWNSGGERGRLIVVVLPRTY